MPFVRRTRATFRSAEFGFFGVWVRTLVQTPRFWGLPAPRAMRFFSALKRKRRAGAFVLRAKGLRPFRTSWFVVGTVFPCGSFSARPWAPYANKKPKVLVLASENRVFRPRKLTHDRRAVRQMIRIAVVWSDVKWGGRDAYLVTTAARTSTADRRRPRRGLGWR